jgi:hypothetical protein
MTKQAMTSVLQTALCLFEQRQRAWQQISACFDVFPSKSGIEFRAVSDTGSDDRGNNGQARSRVCRKSGKAEMYS